MGWRSWVAAPVFGALLLGCSADADDPAGSPTEPPAVSWDRVRPAAAGFAPLRLGAVVREAGRRQSSCFVVVRDGRLVVERYWRGNTAERPKNGFSVTKSVASTLIGIAQDRGLLDIDEPAANYISEWRDTPAEAVSIRNLLSNDSGREWTTESDYGGLIRAPDWTTFAIGLEQTAPPGEVWAYNNSAIQTLDRVLREATGRPTDELAEDWLFQPLAMSHSKLTGDRTRSSTGTFSGLLATCLDLARFGMLFAQQGEWEGEQLVSRDWVREAVGSPSQPLNAAYGLLWWVNRKGPTQGALDRDGASPRGSVMGQLVPDGPLDLFAALGFGGQVVLVDPGSQTVVVRMGDPVLGRPATYSLREAARVVTFASR